MHRIHLKILTSPPAKFTAAMMGLFAIACGTMSVVLYLTGKAWAMQGENFHPEPFSAGVLTGAWAVALFSGFMYIADGVVGLIVSRFWPDQCPWLRPAREDKEGRWV